MIPNELLYGLIGLVVPILAARLGLPILGPRTPATDLRGLVRTALLELLKGLSNPQPAAEDEIRKHLLELIAKKE